MNATTTNPRLDGSTTIANTDGSCLKNPGGKSGAGVFLQFQDGTTESLKTGYASSTNQRAELLALLMALEAAGPLDRLHVRSDSQYAVHGLRKHLSDPAGHLPTANRDLWLRIMPHARALGPRLTLEWVRGHNGDPGNEKADQLAGDAAQHGPWIEDYREIPGLVDLFG
jgi:ribonuclease HI